MPIPGFMIPSYIAIGKAAALGISLYVALNWEKIAAQAELLIEENKLKWASMYGFDTEFSDEETEKEDEGETYCDKPMPTSWAKPPMEEAGPASSSTSELDTSGLRQREFTSYTVQSCPSTSSLGTSRLNPARFELSNESRFPIMESDLESDSDTKTFGDDLGILSMNDTSSSSDFFHESDIDVNTLSGDLGVLSMSDMTSSSEFVHDSDTDTIMN